MAPFCLHLQLSGRIVCEVPLVLLPHLCKCPSDRSRRWWRFAHDDAYPVVSFCWLLPGLVWALPAAFASVLSVFDPGSSSSRNGKPSARNLSEAHPQTESESTESRSFPLSTECDGILPASAGQILHPRRLHVPQPLRRTLMVLDCWRHPGLNGYLTIYNFFTRELISPRAFV